MAPANTVEGSSLLELPNDVAAGDVTDGCRGALGRSRALGNLRFEVATDAAFSHIVATKTVLVTDAFVPAKVQVNDLDAGTEYFYRATDATGVSASGRFSTAADATTYAGLSFGVSGDWRGELSPYPAVEQRATAANLDVFVALGDTIYADVPSPDVPKDQAETLEEFRLKNNEVYSTRFGLNTLGDLRAPRRSLATIDDHEVTNDFAGGAPASQPTRASDRPPRHAHQRHARSTTTACKPSRNTTRSATSSTAPPATRAPPASASSIAKTATACDAAFFVLDARSFRDARAGRLQPARPSCPPPSPLVARTMLGARQVADLKADLLEAQQEGVTWKFIYVPEPIQNLGPGRRRRPLRRLRRRAAPSSSSSSTRTTSPTSSSSPPTSTAPWSTT